MTLLVHWLTATLAIAHLIAAFLAAGHALISKPDPRSAWGWISVCLLFPLAGSLLYYLFGINRVRRRARQMFEPEPLRTCGSHPRLSLPEPLESLALTADALTGRVALAGNQLQTLHNGDEAYPAMLAAIAQARDRVWLSTYLFNRDRTGHEFLDALAAASARGVEVRVLIDGIGQLYGLSLMHWTLRRHGIRVASFFPPRLLPPMLYINLRNHRKTLIIDDHLGFCGGMNIGDQHRLERPGKSPVSDLHFGLRGPIVRQLAESFATDWHTSTGETLKLPEPSTPLAAGAICRVITDGPDADLDKLFLILLNAIAVARRQILLMTPYFIPGPELAAALKTAALRGVDVSILLPARSNLRFVDYACRHHLPDLLQAGVRVYLQPPPFAHHKLMVIDDCYAQIGSANLDPRSLRLNFEIAVEIYDSPLASMLAREITMRRDQAQALAAAELAARHLPTRLRDAFFWLFSPYL